MSRKRKPTAGETGSAEAMADVAAATDATKKRIRTPQTYYVMGIDANVGEECIINKWETIGKARKYVRENAKPMRKFYGYLWIVRVKLVPLERPVSNGQPA